jgi:predicted nuclease of restriction endonuclease-like (RecB) superfamily
MESELLIYKNDIDAIKQAIMASRYRAAVHSNGIQLSLYFGIGQYVSLCSRFNTWGTGAIEVISEQLSRELPGLKGFSPSGIKRMRTFYETWDEVLVNRPTPLDDIKTKDNNVCLTAQINVNQIDTNRPTPLDDLYPNATALFLKLGFSHHYEIAIKAQSLQERLYYIYHAATEFWTVETLKSRLKQDLFHKTGILPNNFAVTLASDELSNKAIRAFKDEYLLDFVNIEDEDDADEKILEQEIVRNIKKFILSFGADFCFIGNQHRLLVENEEYFIDLLFFNRALQCLVAIELKRGKFKPTYLGQLNFYLSALDEYVKRPYENPSIGLILCKESNRKIVELAVRDFNKPMGVATYTTSEKLPDIYKKALPDFDELKKLL